MVNDPRLTRPASYGTRNFVCRLEDKDNELVTFFGTYDFKETQEGVEITNISYWPEIKEFQRDIEDYVEGLLR